MAHSFVKRSCYGRLILAGVADEGSGRTCIFTILSLVLQSQQELSLGSLRLRWFLAVQSLPETSLCLVVVVARLRGSD